MVLRGAALILLSCLLPSAWAYDPAPLKKAMDLYNAKKYQQAAELVEKSYDLKSQDIPLKVPHLAALLNLRMQKYQRSADIVDKAVRSHLSWWPPAEPASPDVGEKLKFDGRAIQQLMFTGAESRAMRFTAEYDILSAAEREQLKKDATVYIEALTQAGFEPEKLGKLSARMQEHEEQAAKDTYKLGASVAVSYWTWEDRMLFSVGTSAESAHIEVFTPCVGGSVDYTSSVYQFLGGGCIGMGKVGARFDSGTYDSAGQVTVVEAYGGIMRNLSDEGSAVGAEAHALNRSFSAKNATGQKGKAEDQGFAIMAVGRFQIWKFELKLKGGAMIANPSGLWAMELSLPVY